MDQFVFNKHYNDFIQIEMDRFQQPMTRILTEFLIKKYGTRYWKVLDISKNGKIDGYVIGGVEETGFLHIFSVAVRPEFEGQGWGRYIVQQLISQAEIDKIPKIILEVREDNDRAIALYKSLGFIETGFIENYYDQDEHAIEMELPIN